MSKIFLSYRRQDSAGISGRIYDRLVKRFGAKAIFMDIDSVPSGVDFRSHVRSALTECEVMLVVIGRDWEGNDVDRRRIDDPDDFVRIEVEAALERALPVIPIVVDRAKMPGKTDLPNTLQRLAYLNGIFLDQGRLFHHQANQLIESIELLLKRQRLGNWVSALRAEWADIAAQRRKIAAAKKAERTANAARRREIAEAEQAERVKIATLNWNNTYDVFISYASKDRTQGDEVYEDLLSQGIRVMRSKRPENVYAVGNVRVNRCFLLLLSKNTLRSRRVVGEVLDAIDARMKRKINRIIVFRLDADADARVLASNFGLTAEINKATGDWHSDIPSLHSALLPAPKTTRSDNRFLIVIFATLLAIILIWLTT